MSLEKQWVLDQAAAAGSDYYLDKCGCTGLSQTRPLDEEEGEREKRDTEYLKGNPDSQFPQEISQCLDMILKWDPENGKDEWTCNHFIHYILEDLRRAKIKPLDYFQLMDVQQGP
jgi:hypothetical protein